MRSFREVLDEPAPRTQPAQPTASSGNFAALAVVAVVLAAAPVLLIQWLRFGSLTTAPMLDTGLAWSACAGAAVYLAWRVTRR